MPAGTAARNFGPEGAGVTAKIGGNCKKRGPEGPLKTKRCKMKDKLDGRRRYFTYKNTYYISENFDKKIKHNDLL